MDNRREPLVVTALVAGLLGFGSAHPDAKRDARPTVSVVSFTGAGLPPATGDAMADELAAQLVETGRYRVLARDWLLPSPGAEPPSLEALRHAALEAGVEYLVLGRTRPAMSDRTPQPAVTFIDVRVISVATGDVIRTAAGRFQTARRAPRPVPVVPMTRPGAPMSVAGRLAAAAVSPRAVTHRPMAAAKSWEDELAHIAQSLTFPSGS